MSKMWMVRGDNGRLFDDFRERGVAALGWSELAEVAKPGVSRESLIAAFARSSPHLKPGTIRSGASQVWRFVNEMRIGDTVLTYNPSSRRYLVGTVTGDIATDKHPTLAGMSIARPAQWHGEIDRDRLSIRSKNVLGSTLTLFLVPDDVAKDVQAAATSGPTPTQPLPAEDQAIVADDPDNIDGRELLQDLEQRSREFIKDKISQLDWEEMQELTAGLLRGMGYKTRIAPPGPDRGADIVASPDGLGFENPRIVVEVKHRSGAMGSKEIRSFLGGRHKDDRGLYVSTGGFTKDARYEADRASIPLTLWELDDIVHSLVDDYDALDSETRQLVPLKRLYWPA